MARVVQQQKSGPPYLLILFVFLFLVSTVIAVLLYLDGDKAKADANRLAAMNTALVGTTGDSPALQPLMERARADRVSVVTQLQQRNGQLTEYITGNANATNAESLTEQAYALLGGSRPGLANAVIEENGKLLAQTVQIKTLTGDIARLTGERDAKLKEIEDLGKDRAKEQADFAARIAELDANCQAQQKDREKAVTDLSDQMKKEIDARDKTIAEKTNTLAKMGKDLDEAKRQLAIYENKGTGRGIDVEPKPITPNGKILKVGESGTVYVNLGQQDRVRPGLTFSVYPATGIPNDSNNFVAKLVVQGVQANTCDCRVTVLSNKNEPIVSGDVVYNVAYDRARTIKFVVVGLFDLYNSGRPDAQGTEEVKNLIRRFGGTVVNEVGTDTDYVVAGLEPAAPKAAGEGETAAPAAPEQEKARQQFKAAVDAAQKARIPILNTNRFLELTGFEPSATAGK